MLIARRHTVSPIVGGVMALLLSACAPSPVVVAPSATGATFVNPLLPSGPDPWTIYRDGFYYYMNTTGRNLTLRRTRSVAELGSAETKVVWTPPPGTPYSSGIWAPEIHHLDGAWYIYFAADDGNNLNHRMWVVENPSRDPFEGEWSFKGKVSDPSDRWAIDGSVFEHDGRRYFIWSGWPLSENGMQNIYIAAMSNPWTLAGERVMISTPTYDWERSGELRRTDASGRTHVFVNEGPQFLTRGGARGDPLLIVYSGSGCWTDDYKLGMLAAAPDSDLLDPASWVKSPEPVFEANEAAGVYAPGHNSFFKSPDGAEDWILYHANPQAGAGCGSMRSPRAQRFTWRADGTPEFGIPVAPGSPLPRPSGER